MAQQSHSWGKNVPSTPKDLYKNIHNSFTYNSPQLETTQMPLNWSMDKLSYVYIMKYYSVIEELLTCATTRTNLKSIKVEETRQKRVCSIELHLHEVLEKARL